VGPAPVSPWVPPPPPGLVRRPAGPTSSSFARKPRSRRPGTRATVTRRLSTIAGPCTSTPSRNSCWRHSPAVRVRRPQDRLRIPHHRDWDRNEVGAPLGRRRRASAPPAEHAPLVSLASPSMGWRGVRGNRRPTSKRFGHRGAATAPWPIIRKGRPRRARHPARPAHRTGDRPGHRRTLRRTHPRARRPAYPLPPKNLLALPLPDNCAGGGR